MDVFIDTTETRHDPTLASPTWDKLSIFTKAQGSSVVLPQFVLDETANHFREDLTKIGNEVSRLPQRLKHLGVSIAFPEIDTIRLLNDYHQCLRNRISELGVIVLPYPSTPITVYVDRALKRRKPFDGEGRKGFRDAIIWETLLCRLEQMNGPTFLVTSNTNDFADKDQLSPHLQEDLLQIERTGLVSVCNGLAAFVKQQVEPTLTMLDDIVEQLRCGEYKVFKPQDFLKKAASEIRTAIGSAIVFGDLDLYMHGIGGIHVSSLSDCSCRTIRWFLNPQ